MLNVGTPELLVILVVALLVLGPNKLPEAARQIGRAVGELRRMSAGFQAEMRDALREPVDGTPGGGSATAASGNGHRDGVRVDVEPRPPVDDGTEGGDSSTLG